MPILGIMASQISGHLSDFTWTSRTLSIAGTWAAAASNGTGFAATNDGANTNCTYSTDNGVTWATSTLPSSGTWFSIAWNGTVYASLRNNSSDVATSPTGATWTSRSGTSAQWYEKCLQWNGSVFCSVGYSSSSAETSPDGTTWTGRTLPSSDLWNVLAVKGTTFYTKISGLTTAATSTDGITWTSRTAPAIYMASVTGNSSIFLAITDNSSDAYTSTDGISWTSRTMPAVARWFAVSYNGTNWVAARYNSGSTTSAATSPDAITWTVRTLAQSNWYAMASSSTITAVFPNSGTGAYTSPSK